MDPTLSFLTRPHCQAPSAAGHTSRRSDTRLHLTLDSDAAGGCSSLRQAHRSVRLCQSHHELHVGGESEPAPGWFQKSHPSGGTLPLSRERSRQVGGEGSGHFQAACGSQLLTPLLEGLHSWQGGRLQSLCGGCGHGGGAQCSQRGKHLAQDFRGCRLPAATCDQIFLLLLLGFGELLHKALGCDSGRSRPLRPGSEEGPQPWKDLELCWVPGQPR